MSERLTELAGALRDDIKFDELGNSEVSQEIVETYLPDDITMEQFKGSMDYSHDLTQAISMAGMHGAADVMNKQIAAGNTASASIYADVCEGVSINASYGQDSEGKLDVIASITHVMPEFNDVVEMARSFALGGDVEDEE